MQIVEDEHDRPTLGGGAEKIGGGVEQPKASSMGVERRWLLDVWEELSKLGEELGDIAGAGAELRSKLLGLQLADEGPQRLHPGPVSRRAARLPAAPHEHGAPRSLAA